MTPRPAAMPRRLVHHARLAPLVLTALLAASCGGGGSDGGPGVTTMTASPVGYARSTVWSIGGLNLDQALTFAIVEGRCDGLIEVGTPSSSSRQFACQPAALGALVGEVYDGGGRRLARLRVDVPVPLVRLSLAQGAIDLELDPVAAPVTVKNFLGYAAGGFYDNTVFHRVIPGFVVQGGGYAPSGSTLIPKLATQPAIALESHRGLSNLRGTLAMARTSAPDSATSQFFVNLVDNPALDWQSDAQPGYAVFGRVVAGLDVVDAIAAVPTGPRPSLGLADVPVTNVVVVTARQVR